MSLPLAHGAFSVLLTAAVSLIALSGCDDLARFSTEPSESYCGAVTLGSSFRMGFSPRVQMRLKLDASRLDGPGSPGTLSTFEVAGDGQSERRVLNEAELRRMPALAHDPLSYLEFGDGRERNAIFAVSPSDPEAESMLAIVSLRADDRVEVRLLRAGSPPASDGTTGTTGTTGSIPPEGRRGLFGIFTLSRQQGECGF
jgi:hypothetical protein